MFSFAFPILIPNTVTKFQNGDIFDLSSAFLKCNISVYYNNNKKCCWINVLVKDPNGNKIFLVLFWAIFGMYCLGALFVMIVCDLCFCIFYICMFECDKTKQT